MALDQRSGDGASTRGAISDFLREVDEDLAQGVLSPRVFSDADLHRAELERIFTRCWVFVGHVSEVATPGDYVLRYVGEDQFILVRDESGEIQLLFNRCVHRASPVCRADRGNASHFRCPYHGWIYRNSGAWNGAPHRAKAYRNLDTGAWGLRKAPHLDTYQGLIFACLDPNAMPLKDYLGDACWYLDVLFGLNEQGMRVVGDPHRWVVGANWKSGAENFVGDAYHFTSLHRSGEEVGVLPSVDGVMDVEFHIKLDGGHGLVANRGFLPSPPWGVMDSPPEVYETFQLDGLSEGQRAFLEGKLGITVFTIFPNLSFIRAAGVSDPAGTVPPASYTMLRQWQPRGPGEMEIWNWPLVWNTAPDWYSQAGYDAGVHDFSPSGIFEQDDTVAWSGGPPTGRSTFARQSGMKLNYQLGSDGMSDYEYVEDWPYPGKASTTVYGELNQLAWWRRWHEEMTA